MLEYLILGIHCVAEENQELARQQVGSILLGFSSIFRGVPLWTTLKINIIISVFFPIEWILIDKASLNIN